MNYRRVLVTGGAGFIGSHLVNALVREGCEVSILDNLSTGKVENIGRYLGSADLHFVESDVRDKWVVNEAVKDVEAIFHLAAITSVPYLIRNPDVTLEVNVDGTRDLLDACLRGDVERFIYVSMCAVYGEAIYLPIDEGHPTNPVSPYAETKLEAERICREFQEANGLKVTILRPFNVYGPRQRDDQYGGVIARFIKRTSKGKHPVIYGDGMQTRDFIHVEDAVRAFILALSHDNAVSRIFNIAIGVPTSINQLAQLLIQIVGADGVRPRHQRAKQGDVRHSYADIREAKDVLGYEPRISLKEGLSTLISEVIE